MSDVHDIEERYSKTRRDRHVNIRAEDENWKRNMREIPGLEEYRESETWKTKKE